MTTITSLVFALAAGCAGWGDGVRLDWRAGACVLDAIGIMLCCGVGLAHPCRTCSADAMGLPAVVALDSMCR
jgi:hypothetical protein